MPGLSTPGSRTQRPNRGVIVSGVDWTNVASGAIGAIAALGGVVITQRSERRKAHEDRVWQARIGVYTRIYEWAVGLAGVQHSPDLAIDPSGKTEMLTGPAFPTSQDELHISLYGSEGVSRAFWDCRLAWKDETYRFPASDAEQVAQRLRFFAALLMDAILNETRGTTRLHRRRRYAANQGTLDIKLPFSRQSRGW
jgi:hypothetical protein